MGADDQGLTLAIFRCIRPWNASNRGRHVVSIKLYPLITKVENKQLFKHFFSGSALDQASNSCVFNWLIFSDILRKFSLYSWLTFSSIWPLFFDYSKRFRGPNRYWVSTRSSYFVLFTTYIWNHDRYEFSIIYFVVISHFTCMLSNIMSINRNIYV